MRSRTLICEELSNFHIMILGLLILPLFFPVHVMAVGSICNPQYVAFPRGRRGEPSSHGVPGLPGPWGNSQPALTDGSGADGLTTVPASVLSQG